MEGHVGLPFPWLQSPVSHAVRLVARAARRRHRLASSVQSYADIMRFNNYPTKAKLRRIAASVGVDIAFTEADEFLFRGGGRAAGALGHLRKLGLDRLAARTAGLVLFQRYMILKARS